MLDDNDTIALAYRSQDLTLLVLIWTTGNTTSHLELLSMGLIHLGGVGITLANECGHPIIHRRPMNRRCARSIGTYGCLDHCVNQHYTVMITNRDLDVVQ